MMLLFESADDLNATVNNEDPCRKLREQPLTGRPFQRSIDG